MELCEGFIVGIFNYCDRWCKTCSFTSRCRLFADVARYQAMTDPAMKAIVDAAPLPQDVPPPPPKWMKEILEQANEEVSKMTSEEIARFSTPRIALEHREIHERATAYSIWVGEWLPEHAGPAAYRDDSQDPLSVIAWFASLNSAKIYRALSGLADFDDDREFPPDHEGSAKVALVGIERSLSAWMELVADGRVPQSVATHCIAELTWLRDRMDEVIPRARAFVRPGFDEPEAVADLWRAS